MTLTDAGRHRAPFMRSPHASGAIRQARRAASSPPCGRPPRRRSTRRAARSVPDRSVGRQPISGHFPIEIPYRVLSLKSPLERLLGLLEQKNSAGCSRAASPGLSTATPASSIRCTMSGGIPGDDRSCTSGSATSASMCTSSGSSALRLTPRRGRPPAAPRRRRSRPAATPPSRRHARDLHRAALPSRIRTPRRSLRYPPSGMCRNSAPASGASAAWTAAAGRRPRAGARRGRHRARRWR